MDTIEEELENRIKLDKSMQKSLIQLKTRIKDNLDSIKQLKEKKLNIMIPDMFELYENRRTETTIDRS